AGGSDARSREPQSRREGANGPQVPCAAFFRPGSIRDRCASVERLARPLPNSGRPARDVRRPIDEPARTSLAERGGARVLARRALYPRARSRVGRKIMIDGRALLYCAGGGVGDSLVASVVARALHRRFRAVDALTLEAHRAMLERVPDVDAVLVDDRG